MHKVIHETHKLIQKSGLQYAVCGGFAMDMFVNRATRKHTDYDITVFNEDRTAILNFMLGQGWNIYQHVWDGKGTDHLVAINSADDEIARTVFCVWAVKPDCTLMTIEPKDSEKGLYSWKSKSGEHTKCDFIEICFDTKEGDNFICNAEKGITRPLDKAILYNDGIPYLAPEINLYFKAHPVYMAWPKTIVDYYHSAHLLNDESREWLINALKTTFPDGHEWIDRLTGRY